MTPEIDPFSNPPPAADVEALLRQGIEDARGGDKAAARLKFERVVELDDRNEKGWFWLASVVDTDPERRAALDRVLELNPNNDRARKALDALEARMEAAAQKPPASSQKELIPGISQRQMVLIGGVSAAIIVVFIVFIIVLVTTTTRNQAATVEQTSQAGLATIAAETQAVVVVTQDAQNTRVAQETQFAIATPTLSRPTLPPTWTPIPSPTPIPTQAELPPPEGVTGLLAAWGGRDMENIGFLPVGVFNLNAGLTFEAVGTDIGRDVTVYANGQRIAFTVYDRIFFATNLRAVNTNGAQIENFGERWNSAEVLEPEMPSYSDDGQALVFVARTPASGEGRQVFLLSLVDYGLRNLTNDTLDYTYPRVSPNGTQVVVVRDDIISGTGADLAIIEIGSGAKIAVSNDQSAVIETQPRWTPDGSQIVYSAALASEPDNHDIYLRNANSSGSASVLLASGDDEIYPVLSPDARFLAYASNLGGHYAIYILDLQRTATSQLTRDPAGDFFPGDWWGS